MNDIKFDGMESLNVLTNAVKPQKRPATASVAPEGVKIQMASLTDLMSTETDPAEIARMLEMKNRVQSGQYRVDTDELSKQLYHQVFKNINQIG
jgi:anti-sigma28 factor (negative regulator of flagellin synthesis)